MFMKCTQYIIKHLTIIFKSSGESQFINIRQFQVKGNNLSTFFFFQSKVSLVVPIEINVSVHRLLS